jgi:phosphate ABC transporter phosphate-binding protein
MAFAWLLILSAADVSCLRADNLGGIHTLAVDSMGNGSNGAALRQRIIARLQKDRRIQVISEASSADAVLRGNSDIWVTGTVVMDPRSNGSRQANYQGYLSIELVNQQNQPLWSYLVSPSRFRLGSIVDDLADHAVSRLLVAIEQGTGTTAPAPVAGSRQTVPLHAAGATLPAPLYLKWFESSGLHVTYDAIGSEAGIDQLAAGKLDFAASDMPLSNRDMPGQLHLLQLPTVLGGVVPIYNISGLDRDLFLTAEALAGIYSGKIRRWNDPAIRATNHGAHLPNAVIAVVHRSDGSGTTFVWSSFLSLVSAEWKTSVGSGTHVPWPVGSGAQGSGGVADLVKRTPNSIGYVELIYAIQHELSYAAVQNPSGRFVKADLASITAAASGADYSVGRPSGFSILNAANKDAYPISTFTWLLIPQTGLDPQKRKTIADLLQWMFTAGQKYCASLGYPPLPKDVAARALQAADALK